MGNFFFMGKEKLYTAGENHKPPRLNIGKGDRTA